MTDINIYDGSYALRNGRGKCKSISGLCCQSCEMIWHYYLVCLWIKFIVANKNL